MAGQLDQMIAYYVARLIYQYQRQKAQQTIAIFVKQVLVDDLPLDLQSAFDVTTAVGPQLDVLGKYIGLPRTIGDPVPLPFFGFVDYGGVGDNVNGFGDYNVNLNPDVVFYDYTYSGQRNTALSDTAFAFMLALKIVLNSNDGTLAGIQRLLASNLPGLVSIVDNQDMTLTYHVNVNIPVSLAVLTAYLPKPMGVGINTVLFGVRVTSAGDTRITSTSDRRIVAVS